MGKWVQMAAAQSARATEKAMKESLRVQKEEAARLARAEAADRALRQEQQGQQGQQVGSDQRVALLESRVAGLEARVQLLTEQLNAARPNG